MADTKLPNGIYAGFRTSGRAEFFAKEHNVEHYEIIWSQAEESWAVIVDDQTKNFSRKAYTFRRKTEGELTMKNTIKTNRSAELEAKKVAEAEAARKAELDAIQPKDIVGTMDDVENNIANMYRDEEGNARNVRGGAYVQIPSKNGGTIAAKTQEELEVIKAREENGIQGDQLLHKVVVINGISCECVGATEEELEADIKAAENYAKAHPTHMFRDTDIAEQLLDAEYKQEDLEQVEVNGETYLISYAEKRVMNLDGTTAVNLEDIPENLSRASMKTILVDRLSK